MKHPSNVLVHATCVAINGTGILLRGASGSGKSDLALRLIDQGAELVADDQVDVTRNDLALSASAPESLRGKIEVRGCGILEIAYRSVVDLAIVVDLVPRAEVQRLPEPATCQLIGVDLPLYRLHAFDPSSPAKIVMLTQQ
ncbi:MAG: aldolase [Rhodospirillaceae bacterium]|nr:aldolase [Rhodospirillaceae bacterium]